MTRVADYDDVSLTENTRAAYPLDFIPNALMPSVGGHPKTILFLTADAFGVLPPISRLTRDAGAVPFPERLYQQAGRDGARGHRTGAELLRLLRRSRSGPCRPENTPRCWAQRLDAHEATVYLVNTGWIGGPYGIGHRMELEMTRAMVHAALRGDLKETPTTADPFFGLHVPQSVPRRSERTPSASRHLGKPRGIRCSRTRSRRSISCQLRPISRKPPRLLKPPAQRSNLAFFCSLQFTRTAFESGACHLLPVSSLLPRPAHQMGNARRCAACSNRTAGTEPGLLHGFAGQSASCDRARSAGDTHLFFAMPSRSVPTTFLSMSSMERSL